MFTRRIHTAISLPTLALYLCCGRGPAESKNDPLETNSAPHSAQGESASADSTPSSSSSEQSNEEQNSTSSSSTTSSNAESSVEDSDEESPSPSDDDDDDDDNDNDDDDDNDDDSNDENSNDDDGDDDDDNDDGPKFDLNVLPDTDVQPPAGDCDIDFLFVIDNSASMLEEQDNIANSVPAFIETITSEIDNLESYHIGVISTDDNTANKPNAPGSTGPCAQEGGLTIFTVTGNLFPTSHNQCGPYTGGANFMDEQDDLNVAFKCAANMGTFGSGNERPFDAIRSALDPAINMPGACNEGFLRKDAILVIIIVTDEEDDHEAIPNEMDFGSMGEPADWHQAVMDAKGNRPGYVVNLSLIGIEESNACNISDEFIPEVAPRIRDYTERFGKYGVVGDICADDYGPFFQSAVSTIKFACDSIPPD